MGINSFYIKREDNNGLAFGGNKVPMLEFILGHATQIGANAIINIEFTHSNFDRQLAAACAKLGIEFHFIAKRDPILKEHMQGNFYLIKLLGGTIYNIEDESDINSQQVLDSVYADLKSRGLTPYVISEKDRILSTIAYTKYYIELINQINENHLNIDTIICSAHAATQAGMVLSNQYTKDHRNIIGIRSIDSSDEKVVHRIETLASSAAQKLGLSMKVDKNGIQNYGHFSNDMQGSYSAIKLLAKSEGILIDPVYTGKALNGVMALKHQNVFNKDSNILFIHTGGTPNLFSYSNHIFS